MEDIFPKLIMKSLNVILSYGSFIIKKYL